MNMARKDEHEVFNDIAVIGMSGRFPGAANVERFWENLCQGRESIRALSDEELLRSGIDAQTAGARNYVRAAADLEGIEFFDNSFFGFTPQDAKLMDPQLRVLLECAWAAIEHAGYNVQDYAGAIGMFAGAAPNTYFLENLLSNNALMKSLAGPLSSLAVFTASDAVSTMVSFKLNLRGPSITVQSACSTSLVAVHLACQSLLSYESDMALAGGVNLTIPQQRGYTYDPGLILSPDGHCRPFDASAAGTVFGGGVGLVLLKRLADALADGDHIHAVIKGSAVNNDGSTKAGFTAPSVVGQSKAIADALAVADVPADSISYVEAHGTGTALGDPIEVEAMSQAFSHTTARNRYCGIGSVKSNIGHLDRAAGVASLIKTILSLENRQIPATINFLGPNPSIPFDQTPFYVVDKLTDWKSSGGPRRAGINSVGFGGTNCYVVLEEAPEPDPSGFSRPYQLLLLSARTDAAIESATRNLAEHFETHPETNLADAAYTLQAGRQQFDVRRALVCRDGSDAASALRSDKKIFSGHRANNVPSIVFMFPGQGAQYVDMGRDLYKHESVFRSAVDRCFEILGPELNLREVLFPQEDRQSWAAEQLTQTRFTQPALFVVEYALAQLWQSWGIRPAAMIGHSIGEYVAACLAGVFSLEDGLRLVTHRARLVQAQPGGEMLAIRLPEKAILPLLDGELSIAALNAPSLSVVSGPSDAVMALEEKLAGQRVAFRRLSTSHAFHSAMMEPVVAPLTERLKSVSLGKPVIPFVSNVTGSWITTAQATDPHYWASHLRQAVRFSDGVAELITDSPRIFLEVGPGHTLGQMVRQHLAKLPQQAALSSIGYSKNGIPESAEMLTTLGRLWIAGSHIDWPSFYSGQERRRVPLPTYPFEKDRFWIYPQRSVATEASLDEARMATGTNAGLSLVSPPRILDGVDLADTQEPQAPGNMAYVLELLKATLHEMSGISVADMQESATFLEMGLDSLFLAQFCRVINDTFSLQITFGQLADELSTLRDLAMYLVENMPQTAVDQDTSTTKTLVQGSPTGPSGERVPQLIESLRGILHELSGIDPANLRESVPFMELGLDSLFLAQFRTRIEERLGVAVTFGQLADELSTLGDLARHVNQELPPGILPGQSQSAGTMAISNDNPMLEQMREQIRVLTLEVEKLRNNAAEIRPAAKSSLPQKTEAIAQTETLTLPITAGQREIWLASQLGDNASRAYNELVLVRLRGKLDLEVLKQAIQQLVTRHDSLRITFSPSGEQQYVHAARVQEIPVIDLAAASENEQEHRMQEVVDGLNRTVFDLVQGPLMKVHLLRLNDKDHLLHLAFHHIVVDGWSTHLIVSELSQIYSATVAGAPCDLGVPLQYRDYVEWYQQEDTIEQRASDEIFWLQSLGDRPEAVELPTMHVRPTNRSYRAGHATMTVDGEMYHRLKKSSARLNCTLFHFLLGTFNAWLHRVTQQNDIVVGVPIAGHLAANLQRMRGCERLVGHCANLVPVRSRMRGDFPFNDSLKELKRQVLAARNHESITYGELLEKLGFPRDSSRVPLISVTLNLNDDPHFQWNGLNVAVDVPPLPCIFFDLEINMWETSDGIRVACYFADDLFDRATIEQWLLQWRTLMASAADRPEQLLDELPILGQRERDHLLVERNQTRADYPRNFCVHDLLESQVERSPDAPAVVFGGVALTYRELNARANRLAHYLRRLGVGPGTLVGVCVERSLEMVIGILAVLKAGGAYVPLDPAYPKDRIEYVLKDAGAVLLLTKQDLRHAFNDLSTPVVYLDRDKAAIDRESSHRCDGRAGAGDLAYVIYTSGSTGKPKGVQIEHRSLVNFLNSMRRQPGINSQDVMLAVTTLAFDIAGLEIFLPLLSGATVVISSRETAIDGFDLIRVVKRYGVSIMQATPATWRLMIEAGWEGSPNLKVLCGGEPLPKDLAHQLLPRCRELWNMYGPTETTIWSTCSRVTDANDIHIGRPIDNTEIYVLDNHLQPLPVGVPGELFIGGDGLARGYLNRAEMTAEKFIAHPFKPGQRLYRTGDLARHRVDGAIDCLGRLDFQVKIRGFRIEPGEIEACLSTHPSVSQNAVIAREDTPGEKRLVAYVVPQTTAPIAPAELRQHLAEKLPDYMLPTAFVTMQMLPLTPNGKIDRKALPIPDASAVAGPGSIVLPRNPTEAQLAAIFAEVLGLEAVGATDSFFDLGGHSLLAVKLIAQIEQRLGKRLTLADLFKAPTVAEMATYCEIPRVENADLKSLVPIVPINDRPILFLVHGAGGNILLYRELARRLAPDMAIYGFQSQGLDRKAGPLTSIEEMAVRYVEELRRFQPQGPYYLGGYCMGGTIAYEMARILRNEGEEIGIVAMLDSYNLNWIPSTDKRKQGIAAWKQKLGFHIDNLRQMELGYVPAYLLQKLRRTDESARGRLKAGVEKLKNALAGHGSGDATLDYIQEINDRAAWAFVPQPADVHLTVFKPEKNYDFMPDRNMGWGDLVAHDLEVIELPVNPHAMLLEPAVRDLAYELKLRLMSLIRPGIVAPNERRENLLEARDLPCGIEDTSPARL
jgi:amino acid adenylation domain-containing protein